MSWVLRFASERGHFVNTWLDSKHTFSFGEYLDPDHMGYSDLRVLNQDRVQGGFGFPMHRHRDMEIVTWVLEGTLRHEDSMGHTSVVGPGGVQRLSAGRGMAHGEFNDSATELLHFLQIWILPRTPRIEPSYEGREYSADSLAGDWICIASGQEGEVGATTIDQDSRIFVTRLCRGEKRQQVLDPSRRHWVQVARGLVRSDGRNLAGGDGAALSQESSLELQAMEDSEIVLFELR